MLTNKATTKYGDKSIAKKTMGLVIYCIVINMCVFTHSAANTGLSNSVKLQQVKDPTRPPSFKNSQLNSIETEEPKYVLSAIFNRSTTTYAVVNGNVVKVGDSVANMLVVDIKETSVIIREKSSLNKDVVLELNGSVSVKKQVSQ